jgi:DNA-binding LacI/PurR family transcriptional regulator
MAEIAVDLVLAYVDDPHATADRVVLPAEVVRRATLGPPPG